MPTTITIQTKTRERLTDYKYGNMTFDDVLNLLMDTVPIEKVSHDHVREHYRKMRDEKLLHR